MQQLLLILCILLPLVSLNPLGEDFRLNPKLFRQLVGVESVSDEAIGVESADGYQLFGVKFSNKETDQKLKPVILFPGLMDSIYSPNMIKLAVELAQRGYASYLVNPRGSILGRSGRSVEAFSWDEMAHYDVNSWLKIITEEGDVTYIGHSQGATVMLAALSQGWVPYRKLAGIHLMAPVTYLEHQKSPVLSILGALSVDTKLDKVPTFAMEILIRQLYGQLKKKTLNYDNLLQFIFGPSKEISQQSHDKWTFEWPKRTASRNLAHWIRDVRLGKVSPYPIAKDDQESYDFKNIPKSKLFFYFGYNDFLTDSLDVNTLMTDLGESKAEVVSVEWIPNYAHMDFVWAESASEKLFPSILKNLNNQ